LNLTVQTMAVSVVAARRGGATVFNG
jgi:hypothetical protein